MRTIEFTTFKEVKEKIEDLKGVSGIYMIEFPYVMEIRLNEVAGRYYVGQTEDLFKRLRAHLGNMNPKNKGIDTPAHNTEREMFSAQKTFKIHIFRAPVEELNYYEEFLVWKYGSFSRSTYARRSRAVFTKDVAEDFQHFTQEDWHNFSMPNISSAPVRKQKVDETDSVLQYLINKANKQPKEKDYGF